MPTSPHERTLYIMLAYQFILRAHVAPISTSPLPAALCPLYLHIYIYIFTYPTHSLAHEPPRRLCALIRNTARHLTSLGVPFFTSKSPLNRDEKGPPPKPMSSTFHFYPVSVWLRCQLHPMKLIFARCYPITSSCAPSLCPGLL